MLWQLPTSHSPHQPAQQATIQWQALTAGQTLHTALTHQCKGNLAWRVKSWYAAKIQSGSGLDCRTDAAMLTCLVHGAGD